MNVYAYISLICTAGIVTAYLLGRAMGVMTGCTAVFLFLVVSVGIGLVLAFLVPALATTACHKFGLTDTQCIRTDDTTVWLAVLAPLYLIPGYVICMFVGRAVERRHSPTDKPPVA